jgi:hypothetical protein
VGVIIARGATLHAGGEDSGCVVGKPSLPDSVRVARDASAVGNGKQRKARSADRGAARLLRETRFIENGFGARVRAVGAVYWTHLHR